MRLLGPTEEATRLRILFVEDHEDTRYVLTRLLRHFGYQVDSVATCESALAALNDSKFQILLCDIGLPDGDGCNLVNQAKHKQPNLLAVALTARAESEEIKRGKVAGFDHYVIKPFDAGELRFALGSWAKRATITALLEPGKSSFGST